MSTWLINGESPEFYGLEVVGGQFASGSVSTVQLERVANFDEAESFAYGAAVTITRDGTAFFKGKCRAIPKHASGSEEGQTYLVEDAWAELERLIYQEPWGIRQADYAGAAYSPTVVLGMNSSGTRITVGEQIGVALAFAVTAGVGITVGTMPTGMLLWPSEVTGMSCAEVIRQSLRFYPDWIPWIDHSTTTPTFNVTPRASATARTLAVTDCENFSVTKTHDRVPDGVRICYMTAASIDDEVYRSMSVDQYPTVSDAVKRAAAGPGILCTTVELAGLQVQIQKQQVQTRDIPTDNATARGYLKKKFPFIADIPDGHWSIAPGASVVVTDTEETIDPIDSKMPFMAATTPAHMPRELVKGNVTEWMRRRVGKLTVNFTLTPAAGASDDEIKLLAKVSMPIVVTGTNAITKIYKGISSYEAGEARPTGIAQAYFETLVNGCYFAGSASVVESDVGATRWHGSTLNLSDGVSEWATMGAPIHTVDWDLASCKTTLNFGPNPDFAVQDFVEFLRLLNKRTYSQFTTAERTGDGLGSAGSVSARGDTVGGFYGPETTYSGGGGGETFTHPFKLTTSVVSGVAKYTIGKGSITDGTDGTAVDLSGVTETALTASAGHVVIEATVAEDLSITSWAAAIVTEADAAVEARLTTSGTIRQDKIRLHIGKITLAGSPAVATAWQAQFSSARITHGLLDGVAVKVLDAAPTHPAKV